MLGCHVGEEALDGATSLSVCSADGLCGTLKSHECVVGTVVFSVVVMVCLAHYNVFIEELVLSRAHWDASFM